jgi:ribosomal-protein-alanine N-acetyltransferase
MHRHAVEISFMGTRDVEEVISIEKASFAAPWSFEMILYEFTLEMSRRLVAKIPDTEHAEIAGYMIYWIVADEIHLMRIATGKKMRRLGVASKLMEEMMSHEIRNGCTRCTLEVRRSNEGAIKLYEKYGFTVQGVRPLYYPERGEDALVMGADLRNVVKLMHHET